MTTKKICLYGMLTALAMVLSYVEAQIPYFMPGVKIGLTNLVVIFALYVIDEKAAVFINIVRILLAGMLFGSGVSLIYSLVGGILSCMIMLLLKRFTKFSVLIVSVAGGISHNTGQILAAMFILQTAAIGWYLVILWFSGIIAGVIIGMIGDKLIKRLGFLATKW